MPSTRTIAFVTGVLFLITFITSIPAAFAFSPPVLDDPNYIVSAGADMGVKLGALLLVAFVAVLFGVFEQVSLPAAIATIPEFLWELFLGIYAAVWGFRRDAPILSERSAMVPQTDAA